MFTTESFTSETWNELSVLIAFTVVSVATLAWDKKNRLLTALVAWTLGSALGTLHILLTDQVDSEWLAATSMPGYLVLAVVVVRRVVDETGGTLADRWTLLLASSLSTVGLAWQTGAASIVSASDASGWLKTLSSIHLVAASLIIGSGLVTLAGSPDPRTPTRTARGLLIVALGVLGLFALDSFDHWPHWYRPLATSIALLTGALVAGDVALSRADAAARTPATVAQRPIPSSPITFAPLLVLSLLLVVDSNYGDYGWFIPMVLVLLLAIVVTRLRTLHSVNEGIRRRLESSIEDRRLELEHSQRLYTRIVQLATDGIIATDHELRVLDANKAAVEILDCPIDRMIGRSIMEVAPIHHPRPSNDSVLDFLLRHPITDVLVSVEVLDQERTLEVSTRPLDGSELGMLVVFRDVTERESLTRFKDNIISIVSHELRTPLTAIRGGLGLLVGGAFGPIDRELEPVLKVAVENSERLGRIVDDLLDVERFRSGRETPQLEQVDVDDLFGRLMTSLATVIQAKNMSIRAVPSDEVIEVDRSRILQVLSNLVQNAVKFSPGGTAIDLSCSAEPTGHVLSVSDRGPGIPSNEMSRVFEPFHRANASDSGATGGIGLGLAISAAIVRAHGGRIWASARHDGGTTFSCFLPHRSLESASSARVETLEMSLIGGLS